MLKAYADAPFVRLYPATPDIDEPVVYGLTEHYREALPDARLVACPVKLYAYTSDEQGIRHALLDQPDPRVAQNEAVFMLGACASFASYLCRNHAGDSR